ncbi:hypothetical protein SAMN05428936_10270 [Pelagibacterium halotolerans]|nr:hypothetical protein SAMN05428936_10270 [Pelagibacterium halotolerans]
MAKWQERDEERIAIRSNSLTPQLAICVPPRKGRAGFAHSGASSRLPLSGQGLPAFLAGLNKSGSVVSAK